MVAPRVLSSRRYVGVENCRIVRYRDKTFKWMRSVIFSECNRPNLKIFNDWVNSNGSDLKLTQSKSFSILDFKKCRVESEFRITTSKKKRCREVGSQNTEDCKPLPALVKSDKLRFWPVIRLRFVFGK